MPATIGKGSSWHGELFRNRFSVAGATGAVSEIKLRYDKQFVFFKYQPGVQYSIGSKTDQCSIQVMGDEGTTFNLVQ